MFVKVLPAGDLHNYAVSKKDSKGVTREQKPVIMHGDPHLSTRLLQALAPVGVKSRGKNDFDDFGVARKRGAVPPPEVPRGWNRPESAWVRHCQKHLVHFINCFHEGREQVAGHLEPVVKATENLVLAGLPHDALHFVWYKHDQAIAPHPHGALLRILLPTGAPYQPKLDSELNLHFSRLVSRCLGFADVLSPQGLRLVHAGRGSYKPENYELIRRLGEAVKAKWQVAEERAQGGVPAFGHPDFMSLLRDKSLNLEIMSSVDAQRHALMDANSVLIGAPRKQLPIYPNTVVVRHPETGKAVYFSGPACNPKFSAAVWQANVAEREIEARELQEQPGKVYARFRPLLQKRIDQQWALVPDAPRNEYSRVTEANFCWLDPASEIWRTIESRRSQLAAETLPPAAAVADWDDRYYPFISDVKVKRKDITDPGQSPLREMIALELAEKLEPEIDHPELGSQPPTPTRPPTPSGPRPVAANPPEEISKASFLNKVTGLFTGRKKTKVSPAPQPVVPPPPPPPPPSPSPSPPPVVALTPVAPPPVAEPEQDKKAPPKPAAPPVPLEIYQLQRAASLSEADRKRKAALDQCLALAEWEYDQELPTPRLDRPPTDEAELRPPAETPIKSESPDIT